MGEALELGELEAVSVLGRGAKGVVFHVRRPSTSSALALKAISRSSVERRSGVTDGDAYRRIWFERDVLLALHHPLLPSLHGVVSTDKIVGFAIDRCSGGDLSSLRRRQTEKMFSDEVIRFYAAELVLALEYLHGLGIVYRDLKPENVLIQASGHIMLVDFDLSTRLSCRSPESESPVSEHDRHRSEMASAAAAEVDKRKRRRRRRFSGCFSCDAGVSPEASDQPAAPAPAAPAGGKSNSFVGTEDYVAPEVIRGDGHDFAVDWWSLGIVMYELLYGRTPFRGDNRKETFYRILAKEPELVGEPTPLRDLISRLLEKDPAKRITCQEIKRHEFFKQVDWESVLLIWRPPHIPVEDDGDTNGIQPIDVEKVVQEVFESRQSAAKNSEGNTPQHTTEFNVF